jgi:hypothetical protein
MIKQRIGQLYNIRAAISKTILIEEHRRRLYHNISEADVSLVIGEIKRLLYQDISKADIKEVICSKYKKVTIEAFEHLFTDAFCALHLD